MVMPAKDSSLWCCYGGKHAQTVGGFVGILRYIAQFFQEAADDYLIYNIYIYITWHVRFSWSLGISNKMMVKNGNYMTCRKKNIRIDDFQFHEGLYHLYAYYFRVAKFLRQIPSPSTLDLFGAILWCKRWMSWCCSRYVHWLEGRATGGLEMTSVEFSRL